MIGPSRTGAYQRHLHPEDGTPIPWDGGILTQGFLRRLLTTPGTEMTEQELTEGDELSVTYPPQEPFHKGVVVCAPQLPSPSHHLPLPQKKKFSDITFIVGAPSAAKKYTGNRVVLAMSSPVFEAMFQGDTSPGKSRVVRVTDIHPSGFENLLRYAYSDGLRLQSIEDAMMTAFAAKKYALPHLLDQCLSYLESNVCPKNVCQIYEFAQSVDAPLLVFLCLNIVDRQTFHVLTSPHFTMVLPSTAELVASRPYLNLYSEFTVYTSLVAWAEEECHRRKICADPDNLRHVLEHHLPYVRFLAMSPEEFAKGPAKSGMLSVDECFSIFMNLAIPDCVGVPCGLSRDYAKRAAPPEYFVCTRYRGLSYSPPGRPLRVFGARFSTLEKNVFLVGAAFPVRLDNNYYAVRQPKYTGVVRIARRTLDGKIERQESDVSFQLSKGKDTTFTLRKPYYIRRGEKYEVELSAHSLISDDVIVPLLRNKKREDHVEGVTFQFIPFTRVKLSAILDITEFTELHFYC
ncbi:BTB/POZ domain-containing protein 6-B-like [Uloborus diversus]|uniref:BTB/POZ domain-containing protein 6-B-like n=1 Tax=Uloborus diversus TaxID=327109 RepID=UPI00240A70BB|nr:BTB/POZ domain-containing protein 6-B-like [Uloborus diversus]